MNRRVLTMLLVFPVMGITLAVARADDAAVKKELQAGFDKYVNAMKKKDLKAAMSVFTDDFTATLANGRTMTRKDMEARTKQNMEGLKSLKSISLTISKLKVKGTEAESENTFKLTAQIVDALGQMGPKGKAHTLSVQEHSRDTFVKTAQGWKMKHSQSLEPPKMMVDGKSPTPPQTAR